MLTVKEYEESLKDYPISNSRRKAKVTKLMRALKGIRKIPMSFPICKYKDLGQHFDSSGKPLFAFLRQFNYEDESKFQWSFAFVIDTANKTITITKMSPSIFIKENKQNKTYKTMKRIRLTESQLHNVIKKCINEAIDNEDKVQKAVKALISILPVVEEAGTSCTFDGYDADPRLCELIIESNRVIDVLYRYVSEKSKTVFDKDRERFD